MRVIVFASLLGVSAIGCTSPCGKATPPDGRALHELQTNVVRQFTPGMQFYIDQLYATCEWDPAGEAP